MHKRNLVGLLIGLLLVGGCFLPGDAFAVSIEDFQGVYSGSYDGADRGRWVIQYNANGYCVMGMWSEAHRIIDYTDSWAYIEDGASIVYKSLHSNSYVYFKIKLNGQVSGTVGYFNADTALLTGTGMKNDPEKIAEYMGSYDGKIKGDDTGTLYFTVEPSGSFTGSTHSENAGTVSVGVGVVTDTGEIFAVNNFNTVVYGQINDSGKVSGEWHNYFYNIDGTVSATREGTSSGGGGGGCFINTLTCNFLF